MFRVFEFFEKVADAARGISPQTRRYFYRVSAALVVLLGVLGLLADQVGSAALLVVAAVLGLADANVVPPGDDS